MRNILILYRYDQYPPRITIKDHLYSFQRYSGYNCFYVNLAFRELPRTLWNVDFDLIVFHTTFLSGRWNRELFANLMEQTRWLKDINAIKVALPQDEFINTDMLCDFINRFGIDYVFSVAPESEWPKIYQSVDFNRTRFFRILTGYLDEDTVARIHTIARRVPERSIDIGYRAYGIRHWLGRHGFLKIQIANVFQQESLKKGLRTDISTRAEDTFLGDSWYEFLLRCKYTIGLEGGASILDRDGKIRARTEEYLKSHPTASFEEVEEACFPNLDGSLHLYAISPRHLEACVTKTCQVLIEGHYNGILLPRVHYIPLKKDLSNIDNVLETIRRDDLRAKITERAYRDVVESGAYTYRQFVEFVLSKSFEGRVLKQRSFLSKVWSKVALHYAQLRDRLSWVFVMLYRLVLLPLRRYWYKAKASFRQHRYSTYRKIRIALQRIKVAYRKVKAAFYQYRYSIYKKIRAFMQKAKRIKVPASSRTVKAIIQRIKKAVRI